MYQVLARKYRPRNFYELVGQQHVSKALTSALERGRLHHAYLFTGTRGVGKTTIARILAKCLNCETGITATPCEQCNVCQAVNEGRFIDLIEIDAASRTKVEDTRELLDNVPYAPTQGRFKVYLIDEVHMLSTHSFNALLKTLEEPPAHVKFLFATTDPQKLPITVISRCLQFTLRPLSIDEIRHHLQKLLTLEQISYDDLALWQLAESAQGSLRDALSLTDQAIAYGQGKVHQHDVKEMLGLIDRHLVYDLLLAVHQNQRQQVAELLLLFRQQAIDVAMVLEQLITTLHELALLQYLPDLTLNYSDEIKQKIIQLAQQIIPQDIQLYYQICCKGRDDLNLAITPMQGFEMCILRLLAFRPLNVNEYIAPQITSSPQQAIENDTIISKAIEHIDDNIIEENHIDSIDNIIEENNVDIVDNVIEENPVENVDDIVQENNVDIVDDVIQENNVDIIDNVIEENPVENIDDIVQENNVDIVDDVIQENYIDNVDDIIHENHIDNVDEHIIQHDDMMTDFEQDNYIDFLADEYQPTIEHSTEIHQQEHIRQLQDFKSSTQFIIFDDEVLIDIFGDSSTSPQQQYHQSYTGYLYFVGEDLFDFNDETEMPTSLFTSITTVEEINQSNTTADLSAVQNNVVEPMSIDEKKAVQPMMAPITADDKRSPQDILMLVPQQMTGEWTDEKWEYWLRNSRLSPAVQGILQHSIMQGEIAGESHLLIEQRYVGILEQFVDEIVQQLALLSEHQQTHWHYVEQLPTANTPLMLEQQRKILAHQQAERWLQQVPSIAQLLQQFNGRIQEIDLGVSS